MAFINKIDLNTNINVGKPTKNNSFDFENILKEEINSTNQLLQKSEEIQAKIATGEVKDLARASITIQKAEMKMKMMLEVRNKAINAYKELMKTQI